PANTTASLNPADNSEQDTPTTPATAPAGNGTSAVGGGLGVSSQASGPRSGSGRDRNLAATMSNATTEAIRQVQISGRAAHCHGISQAQIAGQENTTIQVLAGAWQVVTGSGAPAETDAGSRPTVTVTQVQLGCIRKCFGTTTTTGATIPASYLPALEQL